MKSTARMIGAWRGWDKPLSLRPAFYGICPHWEPIFIMLKGEKPWRPFRTKDILADVINANVIYDKAGNRQHPTPKPLELYLALIQWGIPRYGTILEPFGGTGTTALAAKLTQRYCIMFDNNEKYCEIAAKRCSQRVMDLNPCDHDYVPTFQGGDTYKCSKCGHEIDMTED